MTPSTRDDSVLSPARPAPVRAVAADPDRTVADRVGHLDLDRLRGDYTRQGSFLYLDAFLPADAHAKLADAARAMQAGLNRNYLPGHKQGGSVSRHTIDAQAPYIAELYRSKALISFLEKVTGDKLMLSPDD
ncbi:MAG: 2OG-Fe(II) oxygenase, partial [Burkholderia sp.]|nr:2OG-Fe(II) oxygenase [Burkholderia sp.]